MLPLVLKVIERSRLFLARAVGCDRFARFAKLCSDRNRFIRFLIAGGVNTLFGFTVYSVCIVSGMVLWLSVLVGMLAGTVFNFFTTGGYVFRDLSRNRFPRFVICYLFVYGINLTLMELLSLWWSSKILSQAALTPPLAFLSYFLMAKYVFSRK